MKKIQIISNPYDKETTFNIYDENKSEWVKIDDTYSPNSKLISNNIYRCFFPFKVKEILTHLVNEYGIGDDEIELHFLGTLDHFEDIKKMCELENFNCKINLIQDDIYLKNAQDVLPIIVNIFEGLRPIIDVSKTNKDKIKKYINKFNDSSADKIPLCVIGNYSSGKSTFINALIGKEILPSGDDPVTAKVFKITQIDNDDCMYIKFNYEEKDIQIVIRKDSYDLLGELNQNITNEIKEILEDTEVNNIKRISNCINYLNKLDYIKIHPIIEVSTSFNGKIWKRCNNKFIIIDTPGSNSATNIEHSAVLDEALKGLTNGLPLYVAEANKLDSVDNLSLYNKVKEMKEIDSRFTMIIVNKADDSEFGPEKFFSAKKEQSILNQAVPKNMYSIGLYYVSSIMGLGSKCEGEFANFHSAKTFRNNKETFDNPNDMFYLELYNYDIIPNQIKTTLTTLCKENSNLIYVNSGLYSIELGIQNFANKYSSYNKCNQSQMYLKKILQYVQDEIEISKKKSKQHKKALIKDLEKNKQKLLDDISILHQDREKEFIQKGKVHLVKYSWDNKPTISVKEIAKLEEKFTKKQKAELKYDSYDEKLSKSTKSLLSNLASNFDETLRKPSFENVGDIVNDFFNDVGNIANNTIDLYQAKNKVDKKAAADIMNKIEKDTNTKCKLFFDNLSTESIHFWNKQTKIVKKELSKLVLGSTALSDSKKSELNDLIMNYEDIHFNKSKKHLFVIDEFQIKLFSEKILKTKLSIAANQIFENFSKDNCDKIYESHSESFRLWFNSLVGIIKTNIVSYNPILSKLQNEINDEESRIIELESKDAKIKEDLKYITKLMGWQKD